MLKKLHHVAYRCIDAEATRRFYENGLGLKLAASLVQEYVPSLQRNEPHNHIFFEMEDGSFIAFFDILDDTTPAAREEPDWAQHLALELDTHDEAESLAQRLRDMGTDVLGPIEHGFCQSWYFYDPNGHRLEVTVRTDNAAMWSQLNQEALVEMDKWNTRKAAAEKS